MNETDWNLHKPMLELAIERFCNDGTALSATRSHSSTGNHIDSTTASLPMQSCRWMVWESQETHGQSLKPTAPNVDFFTK